MSTDRKVAIVTGASRGAGRGIARALGEQGYRVYVTGRTLNEGDAVTFEVTEGQNGKLQASNVERL